MPISKEAMLTTLQGRFDVYSARATFGLACDKAGLGDKHAYAADEIEAFTQALPFVSRNVDAVVNTLRELAGLPIETPQGAAEGAANAGVFLAVTGIDVPEGGALLACGGVAELGDWAPEKAATMALEDGAWRLRLELAPNSEVEFKFIRAHGDDFIWESGDNRKLSVDDAGNAALEAAWQG